MPALFVVTDTWELTAELTEAGIGWTDIRARCPRSDAAAPLRVIDVAGARASVLAIVSALASSQPDPVLVALQDLTIEEVSGLLSRRE